jgi:hypothetical protein
MTRRIALTAYVVCAMLLACTDGTTPSGADAMLVVSLNTPNGDDGAVLFTLTGPAFDTVQSLSPDYEVFSRIVAAERARVIVIGDLTSGQLVRLRLKGPRPASAYSASLEQVATRANARRADLAGYTLSVSGVAP